MTFADAMQALGGHIILIAAVVTAVGVITQRLLRPMVRWSIERVELQRRMQAAMAVVERELSPNGGTSIKDGMEEVRRDIRQIKDVEQRAHDEIWAALKVLGYERIEDV